MLRVIRVIRGFLYLVGTFGPLIAQPYHNPILGNPAAVERELADPFVLKYNGEYYLYVTGNPITAFHSTDLVHWDSIGAVLSIPSDHRGWNEADVWAPEVVYRNGRFYLYYTASRRSDDWRVGEMARRVGVAVSDSPRGPFVDSGQPVTAGWGIDGDVFRDPKDGQEYLFYSYLYEPRLPGAGIVVDRLIDWKTAAGRPSHVTRGTEAWEDKDGDPNNGSVRYTNEAPTVLKRGGLYYMMYSGGSWDLPTYSLAYAVSNTILQPGGLDGPGWKKENPILKSTPLVDAPGHDAVAKAPNNVDDICFYHARVVPFRNPGTRLPFMDRLYWNHDRIFMQQPSLGDLPVPDRPQFADNFNRADGPAGEGWRVQDGDLRIAGGEAVFKGSPAAVALARTDSFTHYIFEANLKLEGGTAAGVTPYYVDDQNQLDIWLSAADKALVLKLISQGRETEQARFPVPDGFVFDAYHQILTIKNGNCLSVQLDGVEVAPIPKGPRVPSGEGTHSPTVGLLARNGSARFDGIALTSWFEDSFDQPELDWTEQTGAWMVQEGALHQVSGAAGRHIALKGDAATNYEFTASVRWDDSDNLAATAGIVAAATESGQVVTAGFDHTIWPFARFHIRYQATGQPEKVFAVPMPRGFDYTRFHTIRVIKQGAAFTFFLDGAEIAAARFAIQAARAGVFTDGARATFDDCSEKRMTVEPNLLLDGSFESAQWMPESGAQSGSVWQVTGKAAPNDCCAHSGLRRLVIQGGQGALRQVVSDLRPGNYTLSFWMVGSSEASVRVNGTATSIPRMAEPGWSRKEVRFTLPAGQSEATIELQATPGDVLAVDDFYLYRNE